MNAIFGATATGTAGGGTNFTNFEIQRIMIADCSLTEVEKLLLSGSFAHKWGKAAVLPVDHPFKQAAPRIYYF